MRYQNNTHEYQQIRRDVEKVVKQEDWQMKKKCFVCGKVRGVKYVRETVDSKCYICSDECLKDFYGLDSLYGCECNHCKQKIKDVSNVVVRYPKFYNHKVVYCGMKCVLEELGYEETK